MELGFWETILGLLIHNIPVLILLIVLLISWRHEIVGGIIFTLAGIFYTVMTLKEMLNDSFEQGMVSAVLIIAGPAFIIGILFIINWLKKRKNQRDIFIK